MIPNKKMRTADRLKKSDFEVEGFVARNYLPLRILELFFIAVSLGGIALIAFYSPSLTGFYLLIFVVVLAAIINMQLERIRKLQRAAEFINAAFSSALAKGFKFCMLVRQDGEIVYTNRAFQEHFPEFTSQAPFTLRNWCAVQGILDIDRTQIETRVAGESGVVCLTMKIKDQPKTINLSVEPIGHPKGFALIRGE